MSVEDVWSVLRRFTGARIGLGRTGAALPTGEVLSFAMAHALARDAVMTPIAWESLEEAFAARGLSSVRVESAAADRDTYLRRPDLGRQLSPASRRRLEALAQPAPEIVIVVADGLSSTGVMANASGVVTALLGHVQRNGWRLGPVVLASQARVAIGDEVGEVFAARAVLVLIGERPGLSSPDSLGAYLTWAPRVGRKDAERNCVSNIRPGGLGHEEAAYRVAWLLRAATVRGLTGVGLKDESDYAKAVTGTASPGALDANAGS